MEVIEVRNMPICIGRNKEKYSAAEKEYLEDETLTIIHLAKKYKCDRTSLRRYFEKRGIEIRSLRGRHVTVEKARKLEKAEQMYLDGAAIQFISKQLDLALSTVSKYLYQKGYKTCKHPKLLNEKYVMDETYFAQLDTEEKAYWFGMLMSDGSVRTPGYGKKSVSYGVSLELSNVDRKHLEKIKKALHSNVPICDRKGRNMASVTFYSRKLVTNLIKHGCVPNKIKFGFLKDEDFADESIKKPFLRGYCDGDGHIDKKRHRIVYTVHTEYMSKKIQKYLHDLDVEFKIKEIIDGRYHYYRVYCENKKPFFDFLERIYQGANVYLDRKYAIYKNWTK